MDAAQASGDADRQAQLKFEGERFAADPLAAVGRRRADVFTAVDLRSTTAILDQLAVHRSPSQPGGSGMHVLSGNVPGLTSEPHSTLTWHLNHVKCVEETGATAFGFGWARHRRHDDRSVRERYVGRRSRSHRRLGQRQHAVVRHGARREQPFARRRLAAYVPTTSAPSRCAAATSSTSSSTRW